METSNTNTAQTIKLNIRALRKTQGIQLTHLARRLDVPPNTLYRWELGYREPELSMLRRIAQELGCTIDALIS